ncbi:MAG: inositol monophosphatase family protein [Beijerinckiaceae bacterium]
MMEYVPFMHMLADAAGRAILPLYRTPLAVSDKAEGAVFDPVTVADRAGEAAMRRLIRERYPDHGVIGEEYGTEQDDADHVWVLDPIDGTRAFMSGMPTWGTLIGLLRNGEPLAGMIDQPYLRERFWGDGTSALASGFRAERTINSRNGVVLADATVWASSTFTANPTAQATIEALRPHVRMLRYGSDCLSMAMLAEGHIDIVVETGLEIFDIAATVPVVTGAGGKVTGLDGGPAIRSSSIIAAGDAALHHAARSIIEAAGGVFFPVE